MTTTDTKNALQEKAQNIGKEKAPAKKHSDPVQGLVGAWMEEHRKDIEMALPSLVGVDRFMRTVITYVRTHPGLMECELITLIAAVMTAAQQGLIVGRECHFAPFNNKVKDPKTGEEKYVKQVVYIQDYKGVIKLCYNSGQISTIEPMLVYENDEFDVQYGFDRKFNHRPWWMNKANKEPGKLFGAYVMVYFKDGGCFPKFMTLQEMDKIRERSKAKNKGPWVDWREDMYLKTAIKKGLKYVPQSEELVRALGADGTVKMNLLPDMSEVPPIFNMEEIEDAEIVGSLPAPGETSRDVLEQETR